MRPERIEAVLSFLNSKVDHTKHRKGWVIATCPFAPWTHAGGSDRSPSFGVSKDAPARRQVYTCFSCGEVGLFEALPFNVRERFRQVRKHGTYKFGKALEVMVADEDDEFDLEFPDYDDDSPDPTVVIPWPEYYLDSFKSVFAFEEAMDYLQTRQVNRTVVRDMDLRYDTQRKRVCFPLRDYDGRLTGLHGRAINDHPMKYYAYGFQDRRNPLPWLGEATVDFDQTVLLVESVFDLASVRRVYENSMCALSVGLSEEKIKRIDNAVHIVTFFDHGTGGDRARQTLTKYLKTPHKHVTPATGDPGDMSEAEVTGYLHPFMN